jgi:hypothetical protein
MWLPPNVLPESGCVACVTRLFIILGKKGLAQRQPSREKAGVEMQRREKEERKLAQRRRGVKGRKRIGRSNQRNAIPKSPLLLLFASLLFFSSSLLLCAFASLREISCSRLCTHHYSNRLTQRPMPSFISAAPKPIKPSCYYPRIMRQRFGSHLS